MVINNMEKCTKYVVCAIDKNPKYLIVNPSKSILQILFIFVHSFSFPFYHDYTAPIMKLSNFVYKNNIYENNL